MELSRRRLLCASALLLAPAARTVGALAGTPSAAHTDEQPIVLCWNENPYGPSPAARAAISAAISSACRYDDDPIEQLRASLAHHEQVSPAQIAIGSGSGELLRALGLMCARAAGELIIAEPTYAELPDYARWRGATVTAVQVDRGLRHDLNAMRAAVSSRTRAIYLCNPNNPTSTVVSAAAIAEFIGSLPPSVTTIIDEAYMDFVDAPGVHSARALIDGEHRVVILRTFSKIHGMAGVRCGYAVTRPDVASTLADACMSFPNVFAMQAARASLTDQTFLADCRRRILASRARVTHELVRLGYAYAAPQGNFVFFDTRAPVEAFSDFMRARHILVGRRFAPYDHWCRVTIGTESETDTFLEALRAYRPSAGTESRAA